MVMERADVLYAAVPCRGRLEIGFGTKFGTVNKGKSIIAGIGEPEKWL